LTPKSWTSIEFISIEKPADLQIQSKPDEKKKRWVEPVVALLMALSTLCTAWCSYESGGWTRRSNRLITEFNALERRAGLLTTQGMQTATIHAAMFICAGVGIGEGNVSPSKC
jgi:hypothetical protein